MKKKLLAAAILAAMTVSTATVFASPVLSGDARIEYIGNENADESATNRIRLNVDSAIDDTFYVHSRAVMNNDLRNGTNTDADSFLFDQAYIGANVSSATDVKVGRQSLFLGKGMLMDGDGLTGASITTNVDNVKLGGFVGKANGNDKVRSVELSTAFNNVNLSADYLKEADNKYWGLNVDTKIMDNAVLGLEYVKNTETDATGYIAEVKVGNAVHKGEFDYALGYRNVEQSAVNSTYSTDGNYDNSKGFRVTANYKVADNATVNVKQDLVKDQNDIDKKRTDVTFSVNF